MASSLHKEQEILQHFIGCPNIVRCFGGFTSVECERKIFNLFLEYASGGCLLDLMENSGKIPERHVKTVNIKLKVSIPRGCHDTFRREWRGSLLADRMLDCGLSEDSSYTDSRTNINYISNATYIQTGSSKRILPEFRAEFHQRRSLKLTPAKHTNYRIHRKVLQFTHAQVQRITNNFKTVLDKGGFGTVFHSYLDDTQVVVKMLSPSSVQRHKQFHAEVELLLRVNHRNLTALIGYCGDGINMELIYG
ncbi:Uncharacterized protein TCM_027078 [Theobroma cacao]|uniref:Protein kinase domain-containing protein n=1 Tax=Theobroma cacao TaxID=3641 RepID=A0A061G8H6_THECC|nr:Uncharacterized protein TCM_027078 [Theobroma cacao]